MVVGPTKHDGPLAAPVGGCFWRDPSAHQLHKLLDVPKAVACGDVAVDQQVSYLVKGPSCVKPSSSTSMTGRVRGDDPVSQYGT